MVLSSFPSYLVCIFLSFNNRLDFVPVLFLIEFSRLGFLEVWAIYNLTSLCYSFLLTFITEHAKRIVYTHRCANTHSLSQRVCVCISLFQCRAGIPFPFSNEHQPPQPPQELMFLCFWFTSLMNPKWTGPVFTSISGQSLLCLLAEVDKTAGPAEQSIMV